MKIPMSGPDISALEVEAVNKVLLTNYLSIGPKLTEFEQHFCKYLGARHAVGTSSGTAGLHLCFAASEIGEGDMVITTPFSFVASANVILYQRAIPIFVDVDPLTSNMDTQLAAEAIQDIIQEPQDAERWLPPAIRGNKSQIAKLKAILPVHIFGQPVDMDPILELAQHHNLIVIEDACEAIGAEYKGRKAGTFGDASVFAFYPNKQMTTGEGGMIVTKRDDWNMLFRSLRNQGRDVHDGWLNHSRLGFNYRLDEMSAALGVAQLNRIDELLTKRERVAGWYNERLKEIDEVEIQYIAPTTTKLSWFVYVIRLDSKIDRNTVMKKLAEKNIPSRLYFTPIHLQSFYMERFGYAKGNFPVTEAIWESCLALPFSGVMTEDQVNYVCEQLVIILKEY